MTKSDLNAPNHWEIAIRTEAGDWAQEDLPIVHAFAASALSTGVQPEEAVELSIVLADDAFVQHLNNAYRGKDTATNVLSFEAEAETIPGQPELLGDVILAHETCSREATEGDISFHDHLAHLVVHGVLHLLGYDHIENSDAEEMEAAEIEILARSGVPNPYLDTDPIAIDQHPLSLET